MKKKNLSSETARHIAEKYTRHSLEAVIFGCVLLLVYIAKLENILSFATSCQIHSVMTNAKLFLESLGVSLFMSVGLGYAAWRILDCEGKDN